MTSSGNSRTLKIKNEQTNRLALPVTNNLADAEKKWVEIIMAEEWAKTGIKTIVIREIRELAEKYDIQKVILFGSRARGNFKQVSDIDLASSGGDFHRFALDVDEETSTLLKYDIVNLDESTQKELRDCIEKEGITLYEKI